MILEEGQVINDGENNLIVCSTKEYKNDWYVYMINSETDEVGFYKVRDLGENYDFELVEDEKFIEELILVFAKDYTLKHGENIDNIEFENIEEE